MSRKSKAKKGLIASITWAAVLCLPLLKLCGLIGLKWWVVLMPVWLTIAVCFVIAVVITVSVLTGDVNEIDEL